MTAFWIVLAVGGLLGVIALVLILRARRPKGSDRARRANGAKRARSRRLRSPVEAAAAALRYLTTRREWRYTVPWVIGVGETGCGKTSVAASIRSGRRQNLLLRERRLAVPGSEWSFFDRGVLIDPGSALHTGADDDTDWQRFLDRLEHQRPERPIDGVVLYLSARTLIAGGSPDLQALAEQCYRRLWSLQKQFSFAVPVYVAVTQCDAIPGFGAFWRAAPTERNQIVGWSNPYQLAHEFTRDQVDEAIDRIGQALKSLQLSTAAGGRLDDPDNFFLFPVRLRALRSPLRTVLGQVFRDSGYHASFPVRGIYLTGSVTANGERAAEPRTDIDFVDDLFDEKVFAERNLATPTRTGVWSRNRAIRRLQIGGALGLALLVAAGLFDAWRLNNQIDNMRHSLSLLRTAERESQRTNGCAGSEAVYDLLTHVARIDSSLKYITIPASWVDQRVSRRTAKTIAEHAFERIVFPSLACHLNARRRDLAEYKPAFAPEPDPARDMQRRREGLLGYVKRLRTYEHNRGLFSDLRVGSPDADLPRLLDDLNALAQYVYGQPLPPDVRRPAGDHLAALARVEYDARQPRTDLRGPASRTIQDRIRSDANTLTGHVGDGQRLVQRIEQARGPARAALRSLSWWFHWVQGTWIDASAKDNACVNYRADLAPDLGRLANGFGYPIKPEKILAPLGASACWRPAIHTLKQMRLPPDGPVFKTGADALVLTGSARAAIAGIDRAIALPFMQIESDATFSCDTPLRGWDPAGLAEAVGHLREFRDFTSQSGAPDGNDAQSLYTRAVARHLNRVLDSVLNNARIRASVAEATAVVQPVSAGEAQLRRTSRSLSRGLDDFLFVLRQYRQLGFEPGYSRVVQCARRYAHDNLLAIDGLAAQSRLYQPGINDTTLAGERPDDAPPVPLFDLGSKAATKDYLQRQTDRSRVLAGYATPFVTLLGNTEAIDDSQLLPGQSGRYWRGTIRALNRHIQFKAPDSDVARLERLVQKKLRPLTDGNCTSQLDSLNVFATGNDLFARRGRHLARQAALYCGNVTRAVAYDAYRTFAERFNHRLAAGFPFANLSAGDAPLVTTRRFFRDFADDPKRIKAYAKARKQAGDKSYADFVDTLGNNLDFYRLNLAAPDTVAPVQVDTAFRLRPDLSSGSDQLVQWAIGNESTTSVFPNGVKTIDWRFGQPFVVRFDWADGSKVRPVRDSDQPNMRVHGDQVVYRIDGNQALLRMIERHGASHIPRRDPLNPNRLRLEFNVPTAPRDGQSSGSGTARLFVELRLKGTDPDSGKTVPAILPKHFPPKAPLD